MSLLLSGVIGANSRTCRAADPPPVTVPTRLSPSAATPTPMSGIISPSASALIEQMHAAQTDLTSYSAVITLYGESDKEKEPLTMRFFLAYQKSGKVCRLYLRVVSDAEKKTADKTTHTFVSDGTNCYGKDSSKPLVYTKDKEGRGFENLALMIAQSEAGFLATLPLDLVTGAVGDDSQKQITIVKESDETVDGAARDVVRMVGVDKSQSSTNGVAITNRDVTSATFAIGKTDHLLRRWRFTMLGSDAGANRTGETEAKLQTARFTLTFTEVKANPKLPASLFVFIPAPDATEAQPTPDATLAPLP